MQMILTCKKIIPALLLLLQLTRNKEKVQVESNKAACSGREDGGSACGDDKHHVRCGSGEIQGGGDRRVDRFGFSGRWTVNDQNDLLARLFGLQKVNKA